MNPHGISITEIDWDTDGLEDYRCDLCNLVIRDDSLQAETQGGSVAYVCGRCRRRAAERYERMTGYVNPDGSAEGNWVEREGAA